MPPSVVYTQQQQQQQQGTNPDFPATPSQPQPQTASQQPVVISPTKVSTPTPSAAPPAASVVSPVVAQTPVVATPAPPPPAAPVPVVAPSVPVVPPTVPVVSPVVDAKPAIVPQLVTPVTTPSVPQTETAPPPPPVESKTETEAKFVAGLSTLPNLTVPGLSTVKPSEKPALGFVAGLDREKPVESPKVEEKPAEPGKLLLLEHSSVSFEKSTVTHSPRSDQ